VTSAFYLNELGIVCALGAGCADVSRALFAGESGVLPSGAFRTATPLPLGVVRTHLPSLDAYPVELRGRNNQLALVAALQLHSRVAELVERHGASRVAVVVGTSTSGIGESELAVRTHLETGSLPHGYHFAQQELGSLGRFISAVLGTAGPAFVHSSACASGAKAMASAARLLRHGLADAVVTGGVDSLCAFTIAGFASLNLVSTRRCNPLSANREGINIGEAAALFIMTREPASVRLRGWGESSDGHHFSAPDPSGRGAEMCIETALARAEVALREVSYVNLHATATRANDLMEGTVMHKLFGDSVPVSGSKPQVGHTLGAAGALEAALCWLAMQDSNTEGLLPPHLWDGVTEPGFAPLRTVAAQERIGRPPRVTLSTSFAFGGANAALVLGRD